MEKIDENENRALQIDPWGSIVSTALTVSLRKDLRGGL